MQALALGAEQARQLDRFLAEAVEPVRQASIERGCFAGTEHQVVVSEHESELPGDHIQPLVALVDLQRGLRRSRRPDDLLNACRPTGRRVNGT